MPVKESREERMGGHMSRLVLPNWHEWSDEELMQWDNREFAERFVERARMWAQDVTDKDKYEIRPMSDEEKHQALVKWNQVHAWLEWWLGVPPPAKQLSMLDNDDFAIKLLLAQQIIDEVKHQRALTKRVKALGGNTRLDMFIPRGADAASQQATFKEDPLDIAASLQCTGEVVLQENMKPEQSVLFRLLDEETANVIINDVAPEEPRHIKIGIDLFTKYASTPEIRRRLIKVQNEKLTALYRRYQDDFSMLGGVRIGEEPVVA